MHVHPSLHGLRRLALLFKIPVPEGFEIPVHGYRYFMEHTELKQLVSRGIMGMDAANSALIERFSLQIQTRIKQMTFPEPLVKEIYEAFYSISVNRNDAAGYWQLVAVKEPVEPGDTGYIGKDALYNTGSVGGYASLLTEVHQAYASLFTPQHIRDLITGKRALENTGVSIAIQAQPVNSAMVYGIISQPDSDCLEVKASYGLPDLLLRGEVEPDIFVLKDGRIAASQLGRKDKRKIKAVDAIFDDAIQPTPLSLQQKFCVGQAQLLELANWYRQVAGYMKERWATESSIILLWAYDFQQKKLLAVDLFTDHILIR